jgi:prepilin-type N-terminal cleavage/methylation domain-containing protein
VAFTLIEMLVTITIISLVAAMVLAWGKGASQKKNMAVVEAQKRKLMSMIDNYYATLNYYPPDNGLLVNYQAYLSSAPSNLVTYDLLAATNPLIYELFGGTNSNSPPVIAVFNSNSLPVQNYSNVFFRGGIANADPSEPNNFFQPGPLPKEYAGYVSGVYGLLVPVPLKTGITNNNFWHYDSSTTNRHNMGSYDLWAEFTIGSRGGVPIIITNGNWATANQ